MENKSAQKPKDERKARREEIRIQMEDNGPYSVQVNDFAERWNCTRQTIHNDINFLIKKINIKEIAKEGKKILYTIKQNIQLGEKLRLRGKDKDRLKAIEITNKSAEVFTRLLESYGFKEKIADKHEFAGEGIIFKEVTKSYKDIKDGRKRDIAKSKAKRNS